MNKEIFAFLWRFLRQQKGAFLAIFLIDFFTWSLDALLWPFILHLVIDIFTRFEADRAAAWSALKFPILAGMGLVIYVEIGSRTMGFLMAKAMPRLEAGIRMALFDHIQRHSPKYFNERFAGSLANKITDMTTNVTVIIKELFWPVIPAMGTCILGALFLWFVHQTIRK